MMKSLLLGLIINLYGPPVFITELTHKDKQEGLRWEKVCLAVNSYHEAKNQSVAGQLAVMYVVLNRVEDDRYPNTICGVIKQGNKKSCAFSWHCDGKSDHISNSKLYADLYILATMVIDSTIPKIDITEGSTHYHADYVTPYWVDSLERMTQIDAHIFYRWN